MKIYINLNKKFEGIKSELSKYKLEKKIKYNLGKKMNYIN